MDWWLLTFFIGAILSLFLPEVPAISQLFLLLCLTIGFFFYKKLHFSSGLLFGILWVLFQAHLYHSKLPNFLIELMQHKQSFVVEGEVISIQANSVANMNNKPAAKIDNNATATATKKINTTKRFNFRVAKVNQHELTQPFIIRLSWKKSVLSVAQGQKLSLNVKLKPAHGLANIGSFNYLSWLKANYISATGYVINPKAKTTLNPKFKIAVNDKLRKIEQVKVSITKKKKQHENQLLDQKTTLRQRLFENYQGIAPRHELTPILMALAFGERSTLNAGHWKILQATGTSHLIAISGLHIGLLASGAYFIMMLIIRYLPLSDPRWQSLNIRYLAIFISLFFAVAYAYLAGFSLPTQRALVMLLLYWLSRLLAIRLSAKRLLLITLFTLVIISPFSLFTVSFWLSFYAVMIIFLSLWRFRFWLNKGSAFARFVKGLLIIQLTLTAMLIPISAVFFQQISLVSLAANIVAVPWMSVVSIPCTLLSVLLMPLSELLAQWLMTISLYSLAWLWQYLVMISELPYASISLSWFEQSILLCTGVITFILIYLSPWQHIKTATKVITKTLVKTAAKATVKPVAIVLTSLLISSFYLTSALDHRDNKQGNTREQEIKNYDSFAAWHVVFFDVGQGLSVLIKRHGHGILYDTGAAYPSGFNMSEAVILPYLQYIGMKKLDKVVLSHSDNDHAGGFAILEDNIIIEDVISNDTSITKNRISPCYQGNQFSWQGLTFKVLSPPQLSSTPPQPTQVTELKARNNFKEPKATKQKNDDSCVILISDTLGRTVLLTGDISSKIEKQLMAHYPQLDVDILQVPHHGSKTSSNQRFIKQLSPQLAVVSAGYLNRWYMPVASVRSRYKAEDIQLINSADVGQVIVTIEEQGISVLNYVDDLRPFWFSH